MEHMDESAMDACEDEPAPKRMKISQEDTVTTQWAHLPSLVLTEVFSFLNKEDRRNASAVCVRWRETYFQPRWWYSMTFTIQPGDLEKASFFTDAFGMTVTKARIVLKSVSSECLKELIKLLKNLSKNNNLKDLAIEYSPRNFELLYNFMNTEDRTDDLKEVTNQLNRCLPRLTGFTAACMGALSLCVGTILRNVNPSILTRLSLTAMPSSSEKSHLDQALFKRLTKLEELVIDQKTITDEFMDIVESCTALKKVVVHQRAYFRFMDPPERSVNFCLSIHDIPSRRFIQNYQFHHESCDIRTRNSGQEIIVNRVLLLFQPGPD